MTGAALVLAAALAAGPDELVATQLEAARLAIRRGDLAHAREVLADVDEGRATERQRALLALNEGNVDFWAHDFVAAREHFAASRRGFADLDAAAPGSEQYVIGVLDGNLELVAEELARAERLDADRGRLRGWLATTAAAAAVAVAFLVRGSRLR